MEYNKNLQELVYELTIIYESKSKLSNNKEKNIKYLETYRKVYITLANDDRFNNQTNTFATVKALKKLREYISVKYITLDAYINKFIELYNCALSEIQKTETSKKLNSADSIDTYIIKEHLDREILPPILASESGLISSRTNGRSRITPRGLVRYRHI